MIAMIQPNTLDDGEAAALGFLLNNGHLAEDDAIRILHERFFDPGDPEALWRLLESDYPQAFQALTRASDPAVKIAYYARKLGIYEESPIDLRRLQYRVEEYLSAEYGVNIADFDKMSPEDVVNRLRSDSEDRFRADVEHEAETGRRCSPMSKSEIVRRVSGKDNARPRDWPTWLKNHDLRNEGGNRNTIRVDGLDAETRERLLRRR